MFSCLKLWLLWVGLHSHSASAAWNLSPWSVAPVSSVCFCIACKGEEGLKSPVSLTGGEGTLSVETDSHQYWFKVSLLKHFCNCNAMICHICQDFQKQSMCFRYTDRWRAASWLEAACQLLCSAAAPAECAGLWDQRLLCCHCLDLLENTKILVINKESRQSVWERGIEKRSRSSL